MKFFATAAVLATAAGVLAAGSAQAATAPSSDLSACSPSTVLTGDAQAVTNCHLARAEAASDRIAQYGAYATAHGAGDMEVLSDLGNAQSFYSFKFDKIANEPPMSVQEAATFAAKVNGKAEKFCGKLFGETQACATALESKNLAKKLEAQPGDAMTIIYAVNAEQAATDQIGQG
ncbi:hypothetical protein [Salininema proteolyticum]|uniref:Uncharacterized protein n=1 Tax=Salininema proteolyticum TaxID=1607685 RepID=A0ABV8TW12_9ACTN